MVIVVMVMMIGRHVGRLVTSTSQRIVGIVGGISNEMVA